MNLWPQAFTGKGEDNAFSQNILIDNAGNYQLGNSSVGFNSVPSPDRRPVVAVPDTIVIEATGPAGAVATFTATAQDDEDGALPVTLTPPSGSTFPVGATTVNATAVDAAGNRAAGSFTVTVRIAAWSAARRAYGIGQVAIHQGTTWRCIQPTARRRTGRRA